MFATSFVLYSLLEASELGTIDLDHKAFRTSLKSLALFRDQYAEDGVPSYCFWAQKRLNGIWQAQSANLLEVLKHHEGKQEKFP